MFGEFTVVATYLLGSHSRDLLKVFLVSVYSVSLIACSSEESNLKTLKALCAKDAGLTVYRTAEAYGYHDSVNEIDLVKSSYNFIEICRKRDSLSSIFPRAGCYRLSKVARDSGQCYAPLDLRLSTYAVDPYPEFLSSKCIAVENIAEPQADYRHEAESDEWWTDEGRGSRMSRSTGRVIHARSGEILSERISYHWYPGKHGSFESTPHVGCGSYRVTGKSRSHTFAPGLIEKTLLLPKPLDSGG